METWKRTPVYDEYEVSDLGRVKSLFRVIVMSNGRTRTVREKILRLKPRNDGYIVISFMAKYLHILVAEAFVENPLDKPMVNHKNGNKSDCRAENLEWVTPLENSHHAAALGLYARQCGSSNGSSVLTEDDVVSIKIRLANGESYSSISSDFSVASDTIGDINRGRRWRSVTAKRPALDVAGLLA